MDKLKQIKWKRLLAAALCVALVLVGVKLSIDDVRNAYPADYAEPTARWPTARPVQFAYLNCPDCAEIGMFINLWASPDRIGINGRCQHGQMVHIVTHQQHTDGLHYYKVECGSVVGWVSQYMISYAPPAD